MEGDDVGRVREDEKVGVDEEDEAEYGGSFVERRLLRLLDVSERLSFDFFAAFLPFLGLSGGPSS
jgi:hypothetical protein